MQWAVLGRTIAANEVGFADWFGCTWWHYENIMTTVERRYCSSGGGGGRSYRRVVKCCRNRLQLPLAVELQGFRV